MHRMPWKKNAGGRAVRPYSELNQLANWLFDSDPDFGHDGLDLGQWSPRVNLVESVMDIRLDAELPGMRPEDIELFVDGQTLNIKGEKQEEKVGGEARPHIAERIYGSFNRTVHLPAEVSVKGVEATYRLGVLTVVMAKSKPEDAHRVEVRVK